MHHLKTISREQPALAQGADSFLTKLAQITAVLTLFIFVRDEVFQKGAEETTG